LDLPNDFLSLRALVLELSERVEALEQKNKELKARPALTSHPGGKTNVFKTQS